MRIRFVGIMALMALTLFSVPALSQDKTEKNKQDADKQQTAEAEKAEQGDKDPSKLWVDLSGLMYFEWAYFTGYNNKAGGPWAQVGRWGFNDAVFPDLYLTRPTNYSRRESNTFRMQRAYITLRKQIGEIFSVKITTDIRPTGHDFIYLKHAFIQLNKEFVTPYGPITLKAQGGKIATPNQGITDWLSDLRWVGDNYLGSSNLVLNGKNFDNSADLGGLFSIELFRFARIEYTFTNGEGFKFNNEETHAGKAHTVLFSLNGEIFKLKELYVNFYGRWEDVDRNKIDLNTILTSGYPVKYSGIDRRSYMGVGAAWHSELIKGGVNFFMPQMQCSKTVFILPVTSYAPRHKENFYLLDAWLNFNLGAVVRPAPILVVAKGAYGVEKKNLIGNGRQSRETWIAGAGAGYQFNQHFRMVAYYEYVHYNLDWRVHYIWRKNPAPNNNIYVKLEAKY